MPNYTLKSYYLGRLEMVEVYPTQGKAIKRRSFLQGFNRIGWTFTITKGE